MAKTNLDKFLVIEEMMNEAETLMEMYLDALHERYEYMIVLRKEYTGLSSTLAKVQQQVIKQGDKLEISERVLLQSQKHKYITLCLK